MFLYGLDLKFWILSSLFQTCLTNLLTITMTVEIFLKLPGFFLMTETNLLKFLSFIIC